MTKRRVKFENELKATLVDLLARAVAEGVGLPLGKVVQHIAKQHPDAVPFFAAYHIENITDLVLINDPGALADPGLAREIQQYAAAERRNRANSDVDVLRLFRRVLSAHTEDASQSEKPPLDPTWLSRCAFNGIVEFTMFTLLEDAPAGDLGPVRLVDDDGEPYFIVTTPRSAQ